ncbi:hypothetical protein B0H17DRAFT_1133156 [Mycena rosella]|uniref:Uncharacterized protein n=1 Tax=Mycena rosella TaxID=1033263 RepID=A0AAD7DJ42_MYCRO|nr:hypothetical protein B0H17DRAFT_1133156 [Mycena rosella]
MECRLESKEHLLRNISSDKKSTNKVQLSELRSKIEPVTKELREFREWPRLEVERAPPAQRRTTRLQSAAWSDRPVQISKAFPGMTLAVYDHVQIHEAGGGIIRVYLEKINDKYASVIQRSTCKRDWNAHHDGDVNRVVVQKMHEGMTGRHSQLGNA